MLATKIIGKFGTKLETFTNTSLPSLVPNTSELPSDANDVLGV